MDAEHLLVRYCYVLALLDAVGRPGLTEGIRQGPLFVPSPKKNAGELLAIPHDALVEDLRYMSWLFYDRCHDLPTRQHELNPGFAGSGDVGGADADLIVDGCLMELKASIHAKIEPDWLWQLAGYLLLDYDDAYHITTVGVYMVRQGLLLKWPVEEFLRLLTGHHLTSLTSLRQDFRSRFSTKPLLPRR